MDLFMQKHGRDVTGILSGFDRLGFRGTARRLAVVQELGACLHFQDVLLKDSDHYVAQMTAQRKKASCAEVRRLCGWKNRSDVP